MTTDQAATYFCATCRQTMPAEGNVSQTRNGKSCCTACAKKERPQGKAPTIHDIKHAQPSDSHFFDRASMKFFGQTMRSFSVSWNEEHGAWMTHAGMFDRFNHTYRGASLHLWEVGTLKHLGSVPKHV